MSTEDPLRQTAERAALEQAYYRKLVDGSHILHYHNVLDAYGHLSFRHPYNPDVFVMSRSVAPGSISSVADLISYRIEDAEPLDQGAAKGYAERMIHSEIYKRHAHVGAIVHSHSEAVVPFTISQVPLKACYHMAPWLGTECFSGNGPESTAPPVFNVTEYLRPGDISDMLIKSSHLGLALARCFDGGNAVTLMRGHGMTVVAPNIESAVLRAVYTQKNATIQTTALLMQAAYFGGDKRTHTARDIDSAKVNATTTGEGMDLHYLSPEESAAATEATIWSVQRPWDLWCREVKACGLYSNSI
jgi:ribulose-5-phosphate 4-epimerase/fuculose-1-phosphate aldolase